MVCFNHIPFYLPQYRNEYLADYIFPMDLYILASKSLLVMMLVIWAWIKYIQIDNELDWNAAIDIYLTNVACPQCTQVVTNCMYAIIMKSHACHGVSNLRQRADSCWAGSWGKQKSCKFRITSAVWAEFRYAVFFFTRGQWRGKFFPYHDVILERYLHTSPDTDHRGP